MPLPSVFLEAIDDRNFWRKFFWLDESKGWEGCTAELMVDSKRGFSLDLNRDLDAFQLKLIHPSLTHPTAIAWDDHLHFFPVVFRWPELLDLSQRIGTYEGISNPDVVILLLCRFCPITKTDSADIDALLKRIWASIGIEQPQEVQECMQLIDARAAGWMWENNPDLGYVVTDDEVYSCRHITNSDFPFAALNDTLNRPSGNAL